MDVKFLLLSAAIFVVTACEPMNNRNDTTAQNAAIGAAAGAAIGAAVADDDNRVEGAVIGGTLGAVTATLIGRSSTPGECIYRDSYGRKILAPC